MTALDYQLEAPNLKTEIVHYNRLHRYTIRDQYVNKSSFIETTKRASPQKEQVRHDSLSVTIIHNPNLLALRRRVTAYKVIPTMIQPPVIEFG